MAKSSPFSSRSSSSSNHLTSSRCPECGAPVDFRAVPREHSQVKCTYCGTLMAIPGRSETYAIPTTPITTTPVARVPLITVTSEGRVIKGGSGCGLVGWMIVLLILVVVGINLWYSGFLDSTEQFVNGITNSDQSSTSSNRFTFVAPPPLATLQQALAEKPRLTSNALALRGNDSASVQLVVTAYHNDGNFLLGFDPVQRIARWRGPTLSERYYEMGLTNDTERVYVADGAQLVALDRATGKIVWQSSLANNLQTVCDPGDPCLQFVGAHLVALSRDGTLQAFAGATGAPAWSRRLNGTPRRIMVSRDPGGNERLLVIDVDAGNRAVVLVLDSATGDLIYELQPTCSSVFRDAHPYASDQFRVTPDGATLIIVSSGISACAWRYDLATGALAWQYTQPVVGGSLPFTWILSSFAVADPIVYFTKKEGDAVQLYTLDTQSQGATPQLLMAVDKHEMTLLYPLGELLMVSAHPDYGRDEVELWAIERETGKRRWQRKLETRHTFDKWVTHPTEQGIFLSVCHWNKNGCNFQVLDVTTGTSRGQVREATNGAYSGAAWRGNRGYLTIDSKIYAMNLTDATVEYIWP